MNKYLSEKINKIEEYLPNTTRYRIRLDANESPFVLSDTLKNKIVSAVMNAEYNRYPDPYAEELISAYAKISDISIKNIVCGNGSDELISIITNAFLSKDDRAVVLVPDFSMYAFYDRIIEAQITAYEKCSGYEIDFDRLSEKIYAENAKMVILSNPCNPTSKCYDRETILKFVREVNCLCVIDEAYMEFSNTDASIMRQQIIDETPNLIILKTLSKMGLAALRTGFAIGSDELICGIKKVKSPYNVNTLSQLAATAALENYAEFENNFRIIRESTARLYYTLNQLSISGEFSTIKPDTNFVTLWFSNGARAKYIFEKLHEKSISVRYTLGNCLRITCGTETENEEFVTEFKKLI